MKRLLLIFGLVFAPASAMACDTYTSVKQTPGVRTVSLDGLDMRLTDQGKTTDYIITSAGTGTGMMIARDAKTWNDIAGQVATEPGVFWLGPEKFVEYCQ